MIWGTKNKPIKVIRSKSDLNTFVEQLFRTPLQNYQIDALRESLRRSIAGKPDGINSTINWLESTPGLKNSGMQDEWIRRFIADRYYYNPKSDTSYKGHKDKLKIIATYLLHPKNKLITPIELLEKENFNFVPEAIKKFYFRKENKIDLDISCTGKYYSERQNSDGLPVVTILSITPVEAAGFYTVQEINFNENLQYVLSSPEESIEKYSANTSNGYCISVNPNQLLIIMWDVHNKTGHCYTNMVNPIRNGTSLRLETMILSPSTQSLRDSSNWPSFGQDSYAVDSIRKNILNFYREDKISCIGKDGNGTSADGGENDYRVDSSIESNSPDKYPKNTRFSGIRAKKYERINAIMDEEERNRLGQALYIAILDMSPKTARGFLEKGAPVNWQDPHSGNTSMHIAASHNDLTSINMLLEDKWDEKIDLLKRNRFQDLPSSCAQWGTNIGTGIGARLQELEALQGKERGVVPTRYEDVPAEQYFKERPHMLKGSIFEDLPIFQNDPPEPEGP